MTSIARHNQAGKTALAAGDVQTAIGEFEAGVAEDKAAPESEGDAGRNAAYNLGRAYSDRAEAGLKVLTGRAPASPSIGARPASVAADLSAATDAFDYSRRNLKGLIADAQPHLQYAASQTSRIELALHTSSPGIKRIAVRNNKLTLDTVAGAAHEQALLGLQAGVASNKAAPEKTGITPEQMRAIVGSTFNNAQTQMGLYATRVAVGAIAAFGDNQQAPMMEGVRAAVGAKTGAEFRAHFPGVTRAEWADMVSDWAQPYVAAIPPRIGANPTQLINAAGLLLKSEAD